MTAQTQYSPTELSGWIKSKALDLGFSACGITTPSLPTEDVARFQSWLANGFHASMKYLENYPDKRSHPELLEEDTRSVIVVLFNYYQKDEIPLNNPQIARYARGYDYHPLLKNKLHRLLEEIKNIVPETTGKAFTDSAPILEKALAVQAGLGWIGKNTLLLNKTLGSYTLIAELFLNLELACDSPQIYGCRTCTRCTEACPTGAIQSPYRMDAGKCLSYLTIEHKQNLPADVDLHHQVFGCDRCLDACPYNQKPIPTRDADFCKTPPLSELTLENWQNSDAALYKKYFKGTPVDRIGLKGLKRNLDSI